MILDNRSPFWASELIHPYDVFVKAGCRVTIASPQGGKVEFDTFSDPRDASGYSQDDTLSLTYINRPEFMELLENTPSAAIASADVVFIATPFGAVESVVSNLAADLDGKVVVDCTNPVGANLTHGLESKISGSERIQQLIPQARIVKAFTIYGFENFEDSNYPGYGNLKPAMLIAGNDRGAKNIITELCTQLGWQPVDTGNLSMSLHLEHMTLLWISIARVQGRGAGFVWAMLQR